MVVMLVLLMEDIYECTIEMGSGGMNVIQNFTKIGSTIEKLIGGIHMQTHRQTAS
jgi:hypothetical protein